MALWKLEPTEVRSDDWKLSDHHGVVIVRAPDESSARMAAKQRFSKAAKVENPKADTPINPWGQSKLSSCTQTADPRFEPDGPTEVLDPT